MFSESKMFELQHRKRVNTFKNINGGEDDYVKRWLIKYKSTVQMCVDITGETRLLRNGVGDSNTKMPVSRFRPDSKLNLMKNFLFERLLKIGSSLYLQQQMTSIKQPVYYKILNVGNYKNHSL